MLSHILTMLVAQLILLASSVTGQSTSSAWPNGPFTTVGSYILGADGSNVTYAGVNWPGASEAMVPEGLQYQSIETIVGRIKSLGMNSIRLTYATQMIDQIYDRNMSDVLLRTAFTDALGVDNGTRVFERVVANNPSFGENTTRIQVFDAIATECARQRIYVHLDNHISRASWCCDLDDGNTWWGDQYFSATNWTRGLSYMANHGRSWPNLMSMSLYNELRPSLSNPDVMGNYTWEVWYTQIKRGTSAINTANPNVLIFLSGLNGDTDLQPVVDGTALVPSNATFDRRDFAGYDDKLVLELHSYDIVFPVANCPLYDIELNESGYSAVTGNATNVFPVVMTEWGFVQDDTTWRNGTYATCVQRFLREVVPGSGWFVWAISGSYYVRQGTQDYNETWGLLNHDWSDWRSPGFIEGGLKPLVAVSIATVNQSTASTPTTVSGSSTAYAVSRLQSIWTIALWASIAWLYTGAM